MAKNKKKDKHKDEPEGAGNEAANEAANGTGNGSRPPRPAGARKLSGKEYAKQLLKLQVELCHLQAWVKAKGLRVIVLFEGRDGAGKGGTIKAITERVSPRVFRIAALPAPSDREKSQMYMQRYMQHFPGAGEVVLFDRSWYNRAGVEPVMGFCTKEQHERFLHRCPEFERYIVDGGITLVKFWLEVSNKEQEKRFLARITDPVRQWKLSPMDLPSRDAVVRRTRAPAIGCSRRPIPASRPGSSCRRTTRSAPGSTRSRTCCA